MTESLNLNYNTNFPLNGGYNFKDINLNTIKPPESSPNFFHSNTGKFAGKTVGLVYTADTINNIPKNYTGCMEDIKHEYNSKGWNSDITNLNTRGYCAVKTTMGDPFGMLKYGLDGQARLNHQIFDGKKENFSLLSDLDKNLSNSEHKIPNKTFTEILSDNYNHND